jgi:putative DNA primase/helicase
MTKVTAVAPGGPCPIWHSFLDDITGGDKLKQEFLQRIVGYSLTGCTREQALFFFYGTGGNGKGVFLNTVCGILKDYVGTAGFDVFIASKFSQHPTDLAGLRGSRLVTAQEVEAGQAWAESKIKALTGGDPITARKMRQDFFSFIPQFKLIFAGNHKPHLSTVDEAIHRRFHLVDFSVTISSDRVDQKLAEKLRSEWPGVLQWAIDGCLEWQIIGLDPPVCVQDSTAAYLCDEDTFSLWLEECCICRTDSFASSASLFGSWTKFAERANEPVGTPKALAPRLRAKGFVPVRWNGDRGFKNIAIKRPQPIDEEGNAESPQSPDDTC